MVDLRFAVSALLLTLASCSTGREPSSSSPRAPEQSRPSLVVRDLTCEHLVDPLGIDGLPPRLSWKLAARDENARGLTQSAYQILVDTGESALASDKGALWDSGRVESNETVDVEYAGAPLRSGQRCVWKVRVWDQEGRASEWSAPARFSVGLLERADWRGEWIGFDAPAARPEARSRFEGAKWIWFGADPEAIPACQRFFRARIALPSKAKSAALALSVDNQWELFVNGARLAASEGVDAWRRPLELELATQLFPGDNVIAVRAVNEAEGAAGLLACLQVELEDGTRQSLISDAAWKVNPDPAPEWTATNFDDEAWTSARELAPYGEGPWGRLEAAQLFLPPPRLLRREFTVPETPTRATLTVTALGLVECELNGERVGDEYFTPGWTDYEKRALYRTYDVTGSVRSGANALGATLADGWYAGYVGYGGHRNHYGERTRVRAELVLEFTGGRREVVSTDGRWRASTGPLAEADFLMGERYDARRELRGWSRPGFDDAHWSAVDVGAEFAPELDAHSGPPVRVVAEFAPKEVWSVGPDTWVCNLGQNIAGFARVQVRGRAGQEVVLRYAERLNPDRTLYVTNLRGARAIDTYVCRGESVETWQPRFTFHGFQYVEVTGLGKKPEARELVGLALTSDTPYVSELTTSEPALTRLLENIRWTQRMNFIDVPTDCPQRDERLGWTGDAQVYARTAAWNADVQGFFDKWLTDLADAQRADGQFPMVAPLKVAGGDGGPAWADAGVIVPWTMYAAYGDRRRLERSYPSMQKFLEFCVERSGEDCLPPESFHCFGDWVAVGGDTPHEVIYTAYFAHCARLMQASAEALGRTADAERYGELFARVRAAFDQAYVDDDGRVRGDTQCAYALAIEFNLLEGERLTKAAERLVADIEARGGHFSTGFVGTRPLLHALNKIGREDLAYRLLLNRDYPSWLFEIEHGATSIWERWDGWTPEKGFQDPGMNSFAHYAFGAVGEWMFKTIGGLGAEQPGFRRFFLAPKPGGGLQHAEARHFSIRGEVRLAWKLREDGKLELDVLVPPNTGATLVIPARGAVTESGRALDEVPGVRVTRGSDLRVDLPSGRYWFVCAEPILVGR
jgi:alpha-L-rhamnosidase